MVRIDQNVRNTIGNAEYLINLPAQPVTDTGVDIDLTETGGFPKEKDQPQSYNVVIQNSGTNPLFIKFDGTAASIDTTDDTNANKTYNIRLGANGSATIPDRISFDGVAETINLKTKAGQTNNVWILAK